MNKQEEQHKLLSEWLNGNQLGIDIVEKKYLKDGETFEEWIKRVTNGNEELKRLILEKKFLFGGRILSNRGLSEKGSKTTLSNCFAAGTKVLTKSGYKSIELIEKGEYVMTHDNTWQRVNDVMCREYEGEVYKISSNIGLLEDVLCTPNHKFLMPNGEWKEIKDWVAKPYAKKGGAWVSKDVFKTLGYISQEYEVRYTDITTGLKLTDDRRIYVNGKGKVGLSEYVNDKGKYTWRLPKAKNLINQVIEVDDDLCYFIGRWLGDGCVTFRKNKLLPSIVQIVFNANNEKDAFERCKSIGENKFGISSSSRVNVKQNTIILRFENIILGNWFYTNFGIGCEGKHINDLIKNSRAALLGLLDSDSSVHSNGRMKLLLKNNGLVEWVRNELYHSGVNASKIISEKRQVATSFTVTKYESSKIIPYLTKKYSDGRMCLDKPLSTKNNGLKEYSIDVLKNQKLKVYNLSVEKNHSYVVNGIIAHNCYVLSIEEDSIEGIYKCASEMARTYSYGGGVGIDISKLRPKGAKVNNSASTTTGAVSFMKTYDVVTGTIGQLGRRGALMISIDVNHPDLEEFIDIKANTDQITNANISIRVNGEFMNAVENDEDYVLHWPCDKYPVAYDKEQMEYGKLYPCVFVNDEYSSGIDGNGYIKKVKAREMFMKIAKNNWDYGEPGVLFWDRITGYHLMSENKEFRYAGVNPCLTGDTIVKTSDGDMRLDEIVQKYENGESVQVASYNTETDTVEYKDVYNGLLTRENANIIQIETEDGNTIKLTPDHKVYTENRGWIEAANLIESDILLEIE